MFFRQVVFIVIAILILLPIPFIDSEVTSVIPGFVSTIELLPWRESFLTSLYFFVIAAIYRYLPTEMIPGWYFWMHAALSLFPILYSTYIFISPFEDALDFDSFIWQLKVERFMTYVFCANQAVFVTTIFYIQYIIKRKGREVRQETQR
jgi:hypothetical protein